MEASKVGNVAKNIFGMNELVQVRKVIQHVREKVNSFD